VRGYSPEVFTLPFIDVLSSFALPENPNQLQIGYAVLNTGKFTKNFTKKFTLSSCKGNSGLDKQQYMP